MPIQPMQFQYKDFTPLTNAIQGYQQSRAAQQQSQYQSLANSIMQAKAKYAPQMAEQELTKAQQENEWYPKAQQSTIGLQGAQTGLANQQAKWYGPKAQSEMEFRKQQSRNQEIQNQMNQYYLDSFNKQKAMEASGQGTPAPTMKYGVQTPQPSPVDVINAKMGVGTFAPQQKQALDQQNDEKKQYSDTIAKAVQGANAANELNQKVDFFDQAMNQAFYRGPTLGDVPSKGRKTALIPGDLTAEQNADRAINEMMPDAIQQIKSAMGEGKFSNLDMNYASNLKFSRTMTDDARATAKAWVQTTNARKSEMPAFYQHISSNPYTAPQKIVSDMAWQQYQQQFPLISQDGKSVQTENLGKWPIFTTPRAIESIQRTGTYKPTQAEVNSVWMTLPDGRIEPIDPKKVDEAIKLGARTLQ